MEAEIAGIQAGPPSTDNQQRMIGLRKEVVDNRSLLVQALTSLAATQSALVSSDQSATDLDTVVVLERAPLPARPLPHDTSRTALAALAAALGLSIGLIFLWEYVDYTVRSPEELDAAYGMPALGVIGAMEGTGEGNDLPSPGGDLPTLFTNGRAHSSVGEAFRALRTNIEFANPEGSIRSLLVTSAGPGEGKTTVAANLAVVMAQVGKRVILVDADLRKPRVHRLFGVPKTPG